MRDAHRADLNRQRSRHRRALGTSREVKLSSMRLFVNRLTKNERSGYNVYRSVNTLVDYQVFTLLTVNGKEGDSDFYTVARILPSLRNCS